MSYLKALYETYENNLEQVGQVEIKNTKDKDKIIEFMLLPISHTTQTAHIEVTVTLDGELYDAKVIEKVNTILPFTEGSGSRSGKNYANPHVLHDKLMYVAGDFVKYTGDIEKQESFEHYITQLHDWCESPFSHEHVRAIYQYVKKGTLIEDLVERKILITDSNDRLLSKWVGKEEKPDIFKVVASEQESSFVRFNIHIPGKETKDIWRNIDIFNSYINFYNTRLKENDICYVSGQKAPKVEKHPNKLRNSGDKAKLISSNDSSGFTFKGRFNTSLEAANISYEVSQKAHNALKWLIERQGKTIDGRVFLIWGSKNLDMLDATEDFSEMDFDNLDAYLLQGDFSDDGSFKAETKELLMRNFRKVLEGKNAKLQVNQKEDETIYVLTLDAATPGRLAVLYYRNFQIEEYLEKLSEWHITASWRQIRKKNGQWIEFYSAPSFYTIAHAAYGPRPSDKVVKGVMERLLPCVIDGRPVPIDIVKNAIVRASNPQFFEHTWEWEQALTVACSLVKKHYEKEAFQVALDKELKDRDYLFGRLLAVADVLERSAIGREENRATNALRYMNAFSRQPERTWRTIQANLQPYQMKLRDKGVFYTKLIDEIASKIDITDFHNKPLSGKYLLGYYSQRHDLYTKKEHTNEEEN